MVAYLALVLMLYSFYRTYKNGVDPISITCLITGQVVAILNFMSVYS